MDNTYRMKHTFCANCGHDYHSRIDIPKGTSVKDFLSKEKCEHCGCKGHLQQYIHHVTGRY